MKLFDVLKNATASLDREQRTLTLVLNNKECVYHDKTLGNTKCWKAKGEFKKKQFELVYILQDDSHSLIVSYDYIPNIPANPIEIPLTIHS